MLGQSRMKVAGLLAGLGLGLAATLVQAQSAFIKSLDKNGDGKVSRSELPEGSAGRRVFDGIVEKAKLDPAKTYTLQELEQAGGMSGSSSSNGPSSSGSGDSRRGFGRDGNGSRSPGGPPGGFSRGPSGGLSGGPSRGPSRNGSGGPPSRTSRAVEDVPGEFRFYDKNGDGQIGLYEWPKDRIAEFLRLDRNDDGFLTPNELKKPSSPSDSSGGDTDRKDGKPPEQTSASEENGEN